MRFLVIVKANEQSEHESSPTDGNQQAFEDMNKFNEEMVKAGIMLAGEGLHPSSKGVRIRFDGPNRTVIDGPFAETKELIAGFWLLQVRSRDEAIEWIKRAPFDGGAEVEIRQIYEAEDFAAALTPELQAAEERLRAEIATQQRQRQQ